MNREMWGTKPALLTEADWQCLLTKRMREHKEYLVLKALSPEDMQGYRAYRAYRRNTLRAKQAWGGVKLDNNWRSVESQLRQDYMGEGTVRYKYDLEYLASWGFPSEMSLYETVRHEYLRKVKDILSQICEQLKVTDANTW